MTEVVRDLVVWRGIRARIADHRESLGFVATMGALHDGHGSLVQRSVHAHDRTIVSVFANRTQFNDPQDYERYPRDLEADVRKVESWGGDYVLAPSHASIYPDDYRFRVVEDPKSQVMEARHRPGHFDGVLTVVLRLLQIVRPEAAYFGEKDYQQYELVRDMAAAFSLGVRIVPCPTVRDADGLAMSSRNQRLSPEGRAQASRFARTFLEMAPLADLRAQLEGLGVAVEYLEDRPDRRFVAVVIDGQRLIDNVPLPR